MAPASSAARVVSVVGPRVPERRDDARRREPLDGDERERQLRGERDEADELAVEATRPTAPRSTAVSSSTGMAPAASGLRNGPSRWRPRQSGSATSCTVRVASRYPVTPAAGASAGVVDLQVDEAREKERILRSALPPLDLRDAPALHEERPREGALDRVNEKSL